MFAQLIDVEIEGGLAAVTDRDEATSHTRGSGVAGLHRRAIPNHLDPCGDLDGGTECARKMEQHIDLRTPLEQRFTSDEDSTLADVKCIPAASQASPARNDFRIDRPPRVLSHVRRHNPKCDRALGKTR